jgi:hypothetical protein
MSTYDINYSVNGAFQSTVGGSGTSRQFFPSLPGPSIGVANLVPSSTNAKGQLPVPGSNKLNGQPFIVNVAGWISSDPSIACPSVTIDLVANTGTIASPTYTTIASTGAVVAGNFDQDQFWIRCDFLGDTLSGLLTGRYFATFNGTAQNSTPKATTNLTGINMGSEPPFGLLVGVTFSVSGAKNLASLSNFSLES